MKRYVLACLLCLYGVIPLYGEITTAVISECVIIDNKRTHALKAVLLAKNMDTAEEFAKSVVSWQLGDAYLVVVSRSKDLVYSQMTQLKIVNDRVKYENKEYLLSDERELSNLLSQLDFYGDHQQGRTPSVPPK